MDINERIAKSRAKKFTPPPPPKQQVCGSYPLVATCSASYNSWPPAKPEINEDDDFIPEKIKDEMKKGDKIWISLSKVDELIEKGETTLNLRGKSQVILKVIPDEVYTKLNVNPSVAKEEKSEAAKIIDKDPRITLDSGGDIIGGENKSKEKPVRIIDDNSVGRD